MNEEDILKAQASLHQSRMIDAKLSRMAIILKCTPSQVLDRVKKMETQLKDCIKVIQE